jgi:hypothetical protein
MTNETSSQGVYHAESCWIELETSDNEHSVMYSDTDAVETLVVELKPRAVGDLPDAVLDAGVVK